MSLHVAYSYCINLTEEEKIEIDRQVKKNRLLLKWAVFFPLPFLPFPLAPQVPFFPVEGFSPQQIVRSAKERAESAVAERLAPLADDFQEAYNEYKVYNEMSSRLSKVSKKVRKNQETSKSLDKAKNQLKNGEFNTGRGPKNLQGTKTVFYMRPGNEVRLFFRYSEEEKGAIEVIGESNKDNQKEVIDNIKQNYK